MAVKDKSTARKPSYWVAVVAGVVILAWIVLEAAFAGVTDNLTEAAETVAGSVGGLVAAVTSILSGALALRNFTEDGELPPAAPGGHPDGPGV